MRLLLDTHTFLWWLANAPQLGPKARNVIADGKNEVLISAASIWEIGIKKSLGKLRAPEHLDELIERRGFAGLPIGLAHAELAGRLPPHHRDPFDRMLVAQAITEGLAVVTADPRIALYKADTLSAQR
jgi:PIN domain nuclease of toxin-antitoxin system